MISIGSAKLFILELYVYNLERKLPVLDADSIEFVNAVKHILMHFDHVLQIAPQGINKIIYLPVTKTFHLNCGTTYKK